MKLLLILLFFTFSSFAEDKKTTLLLIGDSLTFGYGVDKAKTFPKLLEKKFKEEKIPVKLINGSVSGSTTASALSRLKWFLKAKPDILFLALGGNDALRALKISEVTKNLQNAIDLAKQEEMAIVLGGMMAPPNYGDEYTKNFENIYKSLAKKNDIIFIPFILKGVAGEKKMNQADGIHPNEAGHEKMAETIYPYIKKALDRR